MDESDESVSWSEREDGYGGISMSRSFYDHGSQSINDEESGSKRFRLSPEFDQQVAFHDFSKDGDVDSSAQSSPLGLTLSKTPSFLSFLQKRLSSKGKQPHSSTHKSYDKPGTRIEDMGSQPMSEKLKASNFPAIHLKIGAWPRITRHEGDLLAKLYYAKRNLVWEVLEGALKSKIEIQWSDIIAIRAVTPDNEPGTLEVELNNPPLFYRETNPQPRKHTLWQQASDFTGGQAPLWRRHYVRFPPGILDRHYERLLQCDERLFALSQKPFPSHESPYFDPNMFGIAQLSLSFKGYGSGYIPGMHYPYPSYYTTPRQAPLGINPNSTVVDLPLTNEGRTKNHFLTQMQTNWGSVSNIEVPQSYNYNQNFQSQDYYQPNMGLLNDIEKHLLGGSQVAPSHYQGTLVANVDRTCSLLESTDEVNNPPGFIPNHSSMSYSNTNVQNSGRNMNYGLYSEWQLPSYDQSSDSINMEQTLDNSINPPFIFPGDPNRGNFF